MNTASVELGDGESFHFLTHANVSRLVTIAIYGATFVADDLEKYKPGVPFVVSVVSSLCLNLGWKLIFPLISRMIRLTAMEQFLLPLRQHCRR